MESRLPNKHTEEGYRTTLMIGYLITLVALIFLVRADIAQETPESFDLAVQETITMEDIVQTEQIKKLPPPPKPPVPVEVPNETILEDVSLDLDASLDLSEPMDLPPPPPPVEEEPEEDEFEIFVVVEQMPEIIGGMDALYREIDYPEIARKAGIEGLVVLRTTIGPDGKPTDIEVIRSAGALLDKAATDGLLSITFRPGYQRGKAVTVRMNVPIRFRLRD